LLLAPLGVCYFPLLALAPGLSAIDACRLSKKAVRLASAETSTSYGAVGGPGTSRLVEMPEAPPGVHSVTVAGLQDMPASGIFTISV
jgi:hypothetical protein